MKNPIYASAAALTALVTAIVTVPLFALELVLLVPDRYLGALGTSLAMQRIDALNTELVGAGAIRAVLLLGPLVPVLFGVVAVALGARSRVAILRWWGGALAIAGGVGLVIAVSLGAAFEGRWSEPVGTAPPFSPRVLDAGHDVATAVLVAFAVVFGLLSLIVALVGIVSVVYAARLAVAPRAAAPVPVPTGTEPSA
jgi:hypothetical protein